MQIQEQTQLKAYWADRNLQAVTATSSIFYPMSETQYADNVFHLCAEVTQKPTVSVLGVLYIYMVYIVYI